MENEKKLSPIISAEELLDLRGNTNYILIDARSGSEARDKYNQQHLQGAIFVDLEKNLADVPADPAKGGRHPLPAAGTFARFACSLGISPSSRVIVYDDKNGANAAARMWWMLRAIDCTQVQVLDGGYDAAISAGFLTSDEAPLVNAVEYNIPEWQLPVATMDEVEIAAKTSKSIVIDVREKHRYDGEYEPIDLIAGHIPGAINIPYLTNLDASGKYLAAEKLRDQYRKYSDNIKETIIHCGSGVTACHTILAFDVAGLKMPSLYTGSWSEWSRNGKPIATVPS